MASSSPKRSISREIIPALYTVFMLLWFRGVLSDVRNPWSHLFFVGAMVLFLCGLAADKA